MLLRYMLQELAWMVWLLQGRLVHYTRTAYTCGKTLRPYCSDEDLQVFPAPWCGLIATCPQYPERESCGRAMLPKRETACAPWSPVRDAHVLVDTVM